MQMSLGIPTILYEGEGTVQPQAKFTPGFYDKKWEFDILALIEIDS